MYAYVWLQHSQVLYLLTYAHAYLTADADRRLLLFYLANDILQNGKRKGVDVFQELFKDPLREAVMLARWASTLCGNAHTLHLTVTLQHYSEVMHL